MFFFLHTIFSHSPSIICLFRLLATCERFSVIQLSLSLHFVFNGGSDWNCFPTLLVYFKGGNGSTQYHHILHYYHFFHASYEQMRLARLAMYPDRRVSKYLDYSHARISSHPPHSDFTGIQSYMGNYRLPIQISSITRLYSILYVRTSSINDDAMRKHPSKNFL